VASNESNEKLILAALEKNLKSCKVIQAGIDAETEDIGALLIYYDELVDAVNNLRGTKKDNYAVSLKEYKNIKSELSLIKDIISKKKESIRKMNGYLQNHIEDGDILRKQLEKVRKAMQRSTVLAFRGKDGEQGKK
jgi:hypothetical protein